MKLTKELKLWCFQNMKAFFQNDPYFKHLDLKLINEYLKYVIEMTTIPEQFAQIVKFDKPLQLLRKADTKNPKYFYYPSLSFQLESLVECAEEIIEYENNKLFYDRPFAQFVTKDELIKEFSDYSPDNYKDEQSGERGPKRTHRETDNLSVFGVTPNITSYTRNNKNLKTLKQLEFSVIQPLKNNFQKEYDRFRSAILNDVSTVAQKLEDEDSKIKSAIYFQTDIKAFYHSIPLKNLALFLRTQNLNKLADYVERLRKDKYKELPIGWILSSFCANALLKRQQEILNEKIKKYKEKNKKLINVSIKYYVDDAIFLVRLNDKEMQLDDPAHEKEIKAIGKQLIAFAEEAFKELLSKNKIKYHKIGTPKTKMFQITKEFATILERQFWKMISDYNESDLDFDLLDELFIPFDNDMAINENLYINRLIKNARNKLYDQDYLKQLTTKEVTNFVRKILYKLQKIQFKYVGSLLHYVEDVVYAVKDNDTDEKKALEFLKACHEGLISIADDESKVYPTNVSLEIQKCFNKIYIKLNQEGEANKYFSKLLKKFESHEELYTPDDKDILQISQICNVYYTKKLKKEIVVNRESILNLFYSFANYYHSKNYPEYNSLPYNCVRTTQLIKKSNEYVTFLKNISEKLNTYNFNYVLRNSLSAWFEKLSWGQISQIIRNYYSYERGIESSKQILTCLNYLIKNKDEISRMLFGDYETRLSIISKMTINDPNKLLFAPNPSFIVFNRPYFTNLLSIAATSVDAVFTNYLNNYVSVEYNNNISIFKTDAYCNDLGIAIGEIMGNKLSTASSPESWSDQPLTFDQRDIKKIEKFLKQGSQQLKLINLPLIKCKTDGNLKITIARIGISEENIKKILKEPTDEQIFSDRNSQITKALNEAIKNQSNVIIFPELSIPEKMLWKHLNKAACNNIIFIGGVDYKITHNKEARNAIVISIPYDRDYSLFNKRYMPFLQYKFYPSANENKMLTDEKYEFQQGNFLYIFKTKKLHNFAVLNCADFLATKTKSQLPGYIQNLFVSSLNYDSRTFEHLANSCIREIYCNCVICNSSNFGTSMVLTPLREQYKMEVFKIAGTAAPFYHHVSLNNSELYEVQTIGKGDVPFKLSKDGESAYKKLSTQQQEALYKYKQMPPGWSLKEK